MSAILKTACSWHRQALEEGNSISGGAHYNPGHLCVEYRTGEGPVRVSRVVVYKNIKHTRKETLTEFPEYLKRKIVRIVRDNERNYRRVIDSVILPDGEVIHA